MTRQTSAVLVPLGKANRETRAIEVGTRAELNPIYRWTPV